MKNVPFTFHKTRMVIRLTTAETQGRYSAIEMTHVPNVGPAMHVHPRGPESFVVHEGTYAFECDGVSTTLGAGEGISILAGKPHRYVTGPDGGRVLVLSPPGLENYFWEVADLLARGPLPLETEFAIAARHGQDFVDSSSHWGHQ